MTVERWISVYASLRPDRREYGPPFETRRICRVVDSGLRQRPLYRLHVKMKEKAE